MNYDLQIASWLIADTTAFHLELPITQSLNLFEFDKHCLAKTPWERPCGNCLLLCVAFTSILL